MVTPLGRTQNPPWATTCGFKSALGTQFFVRRIASAAVASPLRELSGGRRCSVSALDLHAEGGISILREPVALQPSQSPDEGKCVPVLARDHCEDAFTAGPLSYH